MEEYATYSINDLLEKITTWPVGMPVRAMERVLALGESALPALTQARERWRGDEDRDLLWLIVLLGRSEARMECQRSSSCDQWPQPA